MKKITLSLIVVASFAFFTSFASATGNVTCMGCDSTQGGHHKWNKPEMSYDINSNFSGDLYGGSRTYGTGNGIKEGQSYALGEQNFQQSATVNMTDTLAGNACGGTCADNKAELSFDGSQSFKTGGMQESNGTGHSSSYVGSSASGQFGADAKLNWD